MYLNRYLIIGRRYRHTKPITRIASKAPNLKSNEICIKLNLKVPDELFEKPILNANISIPKDSVSVPVIEGEVIDNISEVVNRELGIDLTVSVVPIADD